MLTNNVTRVMPVNFRILTRRLTGLSVQKSDAIQYGIQDTASTAVASVMKTAMTWEVPFQLNTMRSGLIQKILKQRLHAKRELQSPTIHMTLMLLALPAAFGQVIVIYTSLLARITTPHCLVIPPRVQLPNSRQCARAQQVRIGEHTVAPQMLCAKSVAIQVKSGTTMTKASLIHPRTVNNANNALRTQRQVLMVLRRVASMITLETFTPVRIATLQMPR